MILHKLTTSPFKDLNLQNCLQRLADNDGILLSQDAVYAVMHQDISHKLSQLSGKVFMLKEDAEARGVLVNEYIQTINYGGFVELTLKFNKVVSW
ncbi:sulfurtransferase complex subunit TusB [Paraglaciecola marina]|uniref:sulfurtransferase complex subunit TusB n=1 Tax=Paraglaciecola marina TaxID=2500157 RepID=UPI0010609E07|nr:sulfurtransferase complex subunit TusB [Paraglaciecola marina]